MYNDLKSLCDAINAGELDEYKNTNVMTSLPTFGGDKPEDTTNIWSWDYEYFLIQASDRFKLVKREDWPYHISNPRLAREI